ncbi:MarR family winged helix-turn-helix transcriptional regulator [Sphingosinithalassobacter portus]|uniref:MarR family winged helix-turn-helix transcriptional regulator n=1 Tax=Stakelama portus TaxID=2676234 RepID=UPI00137960C5|nr:MarR family transcriptional regulator [Sphingosinithalassobacter portus]
MRSKSVGEAPSILYLVKQVQYKAYVRLESILQPLGVTAVQFRILTTLSSRPNMSSASLARLYDVKPQTMIKQIAILETKGLIGRQVSKANKRRLDLSLSESGKAIVKQLGKDSRALERELLSPLDAEEQDQMRGYLMRLLASLSGEDNAAEDSEIAEEFTREYRRPGVQRL